MTQAEYAKATGLTRARVSQMVANGMPLDNKQAADQWRTRNVKGAVQRDAKAAAAVIPPPTVADSATVDLQPQPPRAPDIEPPVEAISLSDDSVQRAFKRQQQAERAAYGMLVKAMREQRADAKNIMAVHAQAAKNLSQARLDALAVAERERSLVAWDWVRQFVNDHDGAAVQIVKAMPKQLAGRIAPHDPEHAERELERWVQEVYLKTLHKRNPFHNET